jgi:hypothetical protein
MRPSKALVMAAVVAALLAALAVPAAALAEGATETSGSVPVTVTPAPETPPATATPAPRAKPGRKLINKFRAMALTRQRSFNADVRLVTRRLNRLGTIATLAHNSGGDVTAVRAEIAAARVHLTEAKRLEIVAFNKMRLVPWAANRNAALVEANAAWKTARAELRAGRLDKQAAAHDLWAMVKQLRLTKKVSVKDFS